MGNAAQSVRQGLARLPFTVKGALIVGLALCLRLLFFTGIGSADDVFVGNAALRVLEEGPYLATSHYTGRLSLIYPLVGIFTTLGVGEWQMAILPLLSSLGAIVLAGLFARRYFGDAAAMWALAAGAVFPLDVFFSTQLMPDLPLGTLLAAGLYCALRATDKTGRAAVWALAGGLLWGAAYLIKIEAAFLLFPMAFLYWSHERNWRLALLTAAGCAVFVVGENIIYWALTGEILYRLKIIGESAPITVSDAFSAQQLWVFPKAWFLTAYQFSLHYYLLFIALATVLLRREQSGYLMVVWAAAFLIWLQFGMNPFADQIEFKSHLQRYCLMLAVPTYALIGYQMSVIQARLPKIGAGFAALWLVGSVFLVAFNYLGAERDQATKQALKDWSYGKEAPIYMDAGSYTIAQFLYYGDSWREMFRHAYSHDFHTAKTEVVDVATIDGYLLINRGFVAFSSNRYFVQGIAAEKVASHCRLAMTVDNPSYGVSYSAARLLRGVVGLVPVASLREKIEATADDLLMGADVSIYACGSARQ